MNNSGLTPREIVERLDRHIIGQADAKRAVAIATAGGGRMCLRSWRMKFRRKISS